MRLGLRQKLVLGGLAIVAVVSFGFRAVVDGAETPTSAPRRRPPSPVVTIP